jgi:hypothetical protein
VDIVLVRGLVIRGFAYGATELSLESLLIERSLSINTASAGNASLMAIGWLGRSPCQGQGLNFRALGKGLRNCGGKQENARFFLHAIRWVLWATNSRKSMKC